MNDYKQPLMELFALIYIFPTLDKRIKDKESKGSGNKCDKCNCDWGKASDEYFIAIFNMKDGEMVDSGRADGRIPDKLLCQSCWEKEEPQYRKEAGRNGDATKTKMVQKGKEEQGHVSFTICYNWNTKQWTENVKEDLGSPDKEEPEKEKCADCQTEKKPEELTTIPDQGKDIKVCAECKQKRDNKPDKPEIPQKDKDNPDPSQDDPTKNPHPDNIKIWGSDFGQLKPLQREGRVATNNSWKKSCEKEGSRRDLICPYCQDKFTFKKTITDFLPAQKEVEERLNAHKNSCPLKNDKSEQKRKAQEEWDKIRASKGKITRAYTCKKCWGRVLQDAKIVDVELAKRQNWADFQQHQKECHRPENERKIAVYHSPNKGGNEHANINDFTYEDMDDYPLEENKEGEAYQEQNPSQTSNDGMNKGLIIGLSILGGIVVIGGIIFLLTRNKKKIK